MWKKRFDNYAHNQYYPFHAEILYDKFQHHKVVCDSFEDIILQINLIIRNSCFIRIKLDFREFHEIFMKFYICQTIVYTKSGQLLVI